MITPCARRSASISRRTSAERSLDSDLALALCREVGDRQGESETLAYLGLLYHHLGDDENAVGFCLDAVAIAGEVGLPYLEALALTIPITLWLARAIPTQPREAAVAEALNLVDGHFGYNAVFATRRLRFVQRTLTRRGELPRLIAWYGR